MKFRNFPNFSISPCSKNKLQNSTQLFSICVCMCVSVRKTSTKEFSPSFQTQQMTECNCFQTSILSSILLLVFFLQIILFWGKWCNRVFGNNSNAVGIQHEYHTNIHSIVVILFSCSYVISSPASLIVYLKDHFFAYFFFLAFCVWRIYHSKDGGKKRQRSFVDEAPLVLVVIVIVIVIMVILVILVILIMIIDNVSLSLNSTNSRFNFMDKQ